MLAELREEEESVNAERRREKRLAYFDVNTSELPTCLTQPLRRRPMRRLIVLMPLRPPLVRILPSLFEQHLIIHHSSPNRIRNRSASFDGDDTVTEGSVEFVEGEESEERGEEGEEDAGATGGRVRLETCSEGEELSDWEATT